MKRGFFALLLAAGAIGLAPPTLASNMGADGEYPVQVQFEACDGHDPQTACEYQERIRRQAVLVTGVCMVGALQQGTRVMERLYCEPYPEASAN